MAANGPLKSKDVKRKQTRPVGEFGGNLGCLFFLLYIPTQIYYFYGCLVLHRGQLAVPNGQFWYDLYYTLPEGVAIRPTTKSFIVLSIWVVFQAVLEIFMPGPIVEGVVLKNGRKLPYPMNGLLCFFLSHIGVYAAAWFGLIEPWFVWANMGALLTGGVVMSTLMALWLYVDFGIFWRRHVNDPEFEEDWGVFAYKDFFNDLFLGVARNPRIFHTWLKTPFDVKRFWNARPGLTLWVICNQSYLASQYFGCRLVDNQAICNATGDWANVGNSMWLITLAHWYYIFDYNWNEPAYLTTTDIRHDLFGWMLTYGDFGFLVWFYPFAFGGYLSFLEQPLVNNTFHFAGGLLMYVVGMFLFRATNIQKHNFRTYVASGQDLSKYMVWGKPVKYIRTEEGSYLLLSGYWGLARHFNYIGDMIMCLGWALACSGPGLGIPWVPLSYCGYFWTMDIHRMFRDEHRCREKYKKDWAQYHAAVKWRIFPGIF